jgi:hypothetical protein
MVHPSLFLHASADESNFYEISIALFLLIRTATTGQAATRLQKPDFQ